MTSEELIKEKLHRNCNSRRTWNGRFATALQRFTGCPRRIALQASHGANNWQEISPEDAAQCEAEYWMEDME